MTAAPTLCSIITAFVACLLAQAEHGEHRAAELVSEARRLSALYAVQHGVAALDGAQCSTASADDRGCRQDLSLLQATAVAHHRSVASAVPPVGVVAPSAANRHARHVASAALDATGTRSAAPQPAGEANVAVKSGSEPAGIVDQAAQRAELEAVEATELATDLPQDSPRSEGTEIAHLGPQTAAEEEPRQQQADSPQAGAVAPLAESATDPSEEMVEGTEAEARAAADVAAQRGGTEEQVGEERLSTDAEVPDDGLEPEAAEADASQENKNLEVTETEAEPHLEPQLAADRHPRWQEARLIRALFPQLGVETAKAQAHAHRGSSVQPAVAPLEAALRSLGALWGQLPSLAPRRQQAATSVLQSAASSTAEVAAGAGTTAGEGDIVQGLAFTLICLIIVIGIYLVVFNEYRPGAAAVPLSFDRTANGRPSVWRWGEGAAGGMLTGLGSSRLASSKSLASGRETLQAASVTQISRFGGMPGTPPSTLPTPQERISSIVGGSREDDWYNELPQIYPQLVIPAAHTRLAVPLAHLTQPSFVLDVLSRNGLRLLNAHLVEGPEPTIEVSLEDGGLLATVSSDLVLCGRDGQRFGTLCREHVAPQLGLTDCPQLVLRDRIRRPVCVLVVTRRDAAGYDFKLHSVLAGRLVERATAVRRPPQPPPHGHLPGEHYELVVNPQVDSVLVLAILLGAVVFAMPPPSGYIQPPMSGRQSTGV